LGIEPSTFQLGINPPTTTLPQPLESRPLKVYSLVFVENVEGVQEGEVSGDTFEVLLGDVAVSVVVVVPENRLERDKIEKHMNILELSVKRVINGVNANQI
jgi:hypothetical protein